MENSKIIVDNTGKLILENARILYRNFSGAASAYNHEGDRNFCVIIDDPDAIADLQEAGWNLKFRAPREEEDPTLHYLKVNVSYKYRGPKIFRHIGNSTVEVLEDTVSELDKDDILYCDMVIAPYRYSRQGQEGISAYLQELHAVIRPDYFGNKYANME
jgi:hypothetical protein